MTEAIRRAWRLLTYKPSTHLRLDILNVTHDPQSNRTAVTYRLRAMRPPTNAWRHP